MNRAGYDFVRLWIFAFLEGGEKKNPERKMRSGTQYPASREVWGIPMTVCPISGSTCRYGMPPGLQAEVPDMRGLYPRFVRVLLPVSLPVQPRYHKTLQRNSGLLEGTLHLRSPTDRVDVERPAAIVSGLCSGLRRICDVAANTLPSLEIDKDRFCRPSACS